MFIVSRDAPGLYARLQGTFGGRGIQVIFDRREPDEPRRPPPSWDESPHHNRRRHSVDQDLRIQGWAVVKTPD